MALPGTLEVSDAGAAAYTIPIEVPPGTAGMQPSLALQYNSRGGNGVLGMGWSLSGLPAITRCPQTPAQDGGRAGVAFNFNDRFCLEGERLVAISGGYAADGTEYRTERDGFSRIISHGSAGSGPAWFEVHTKAGQVMQFGNTTDSRVLAYGTPTARLWAVNQVTDTKSNYLTVAYYQDQTYSPQYFPTRIDYGGNLASGTAPSASVIFVYETRPDIVPVFVAGSLIRPTTRLTHIQTYAGVALVRDNQLTYAQSGASQRSLLTSITACSQSGACLPASTFGWTNEGYPFNVFGNLYGQDGLVVAYRPILADFNGDGKTDILWDNEDQYGRSTGADRGIWFSAGDGTFINGVGNLAGQNGNLVNYRIYVGDFNADGISDIFWDSEDQYGRSTGYRGIWFGNGQGGFGGVFNLANADGAMVGFRPILTDIDGDGRTDIFWDSEDQYGRSTGVRGIWFGNGDGTFRGLGNIAGQDGNMGGYRPILADFNGDGFPDILWDSEDQYGRSSGTRILWFGGGNGTFGGIGNLAGADGQLGGYRPILGDFNGDGLPDILWDSEDQNGLSTGSRGLWLGRGDGTFITMGNLGNSDGNLIGYRMMLGDFNGDGRTDIFWDAEDAYGRSTGAPRAIWQSNGDGTFIGIGNIGGADGTIGGWNPQLGDFNGDGKTDVLWDSSDQYGRSTGSRALWLSSPTPNDLLASVSKGLGGVPTTINYVSLANPGPHYTRDSNAPYPMIDVQSSLFVAANASMDNGQGGPYSLSYSYVGARADLSGRGFLGFRQLTVTDPQSGAVTTTTYRLDFPFTGLVWGVGKSSGPHMLNSTTNTYACVNENAASGFCPATSLGAHYFVSLQQSLEASWDLTGTALPAVTTTNQYDPYGNATQVAVTTGDGYSKTTTNTYTNDTTNWFLGRLTGASVTSTTP
jgi:hypothetical protein